MSWGAPKGTGAEGGGPTVSVPVGGLLALLGHNVERRQLLPAHPPSPLLQSTGRPWKNWVPNTAQTRGPLSPDSLHDAPSAERSCGLSGRRQPWWRTCCGGSSQPRPGMESWEPPAVRGRPEAAEGTGQDPALGVGGVPGRDLEGGAGRPSSEAPSSPTRSRSLVMPTSLTAFRSPSVGPATVAPSVQPVMGWEVGSRCGWELGYLKG